MSLEKSKDPTIHSTEVDSAESAPHDPAKRQTLKVAVGSVAALASGGVAAACGNHQLLQTAKANTNELLDNTDPALARFSVAVKHSWAHNDISVVITNRGDDASRITSITPMQINLPRGTLDFSSLLANGDVQLRPGESLTVPLQARKSTDSSTLIGEMALPANRKRVAKGTGLGHFDRSLQRSLRQQVSIVTEGDSFAAVTVVDGPVVG